MAFVSDIRQLDKRLGNVIRADRMMHGKTSEMHHQGTSVFTGLPSPFTATRYHSLIVERSSLPDCLEITAETAEGDYGPASQNICD